MPPRHPATVEFDPVPFPGGAEAALEFAAFEKGMLERGSGRGRDREPSVERQAPLSEPQRHSVRWMLAGAGTAIAAAIVILLLGSGLLAAGLAAAGRAVAPS